MIMGVVWDSLESNIDKFMNPKTHIAHTTLFAVSAVMTLAYAISWSSSADNGLALTNIRLLRADELQDRTADISKDALLKRWKCDAAVDPWGPDSMCRCIQRETCTGNTCGGEVQSKCYAMVAPTFANVFAGYDIGFFNVLLALFLIHISVLLNMTIETKEDEMKAMAVSTQASKSTPENPLRVDNNHGDTANDKKNPPKPVDQNNEDEYDPNFIPGISKKYERKMIPLRHFVATGGKGDKNPLLENQDNYVATPEPPRNFVQNEYLRLALLLALTVACFIVTSISTAKKEQMRKPGQTCNLSDSTCMTQTFLTLMSYAVCVANGVLFGLETWRHYAKKEEWNALTGHFMACVLEDANHTLAFMLLASTFASLSGVHDDATVLFDILVVMFIGLLQSVQHHVMLQREHVIRYCHHTDQQPGDVYQDHLGRGVSVAKDVMSYFLYTRLFIFVVMIGSAVAFLQRIEPSILSNDTNATWNYHMRNVALLVSVLPHIMGDVAYEIYHATRLRMVGDHTPYTGSGCWRRTIYLLYIIIYMLLSWKTYNFEAV
jgi:uncharacterized BrkB/YihY/UPF0761 family membrane protein